MRIIIKFSIVIPLILMTVFCFAQSGEIKAFLVEQMEIHKIPAVSAAIVEKGKVVFLETLGTASLEHGVPNTEGTAFQLASATKLIAATGIIWLVQQGKLDLDQNVNFYLPDVPDSWADMRVMDLVSHQSGIADLLAMQYHFKSLEEALDTAYSRSLDFEPGTRTVYAGGDYAVVNKLVEKVTGLSFQEFLKKEILEKLSMSHTLYNNMEQDFIYRTLDTISYAATVYKWDEKNGKQQIFSMMFPSWTYPAGGLFSSITDLTRWVIALDEHTLLKSEYAERMWTAAELRNGGTSPFGIGWIVAEHNGEKATGHSGGPALSDIVRLPDKKITAIVLTNQVELRPYLTMKILDLYQGYRNDSSGQN
jgi:CubicO group peptidase (beta-lactamase class C family)